MKQQYIRRVKKALNLPREQKAEVLRDLDEAFASALEHGETERQVIELSANSSGWARRMSLQTAYMNSSESPAPTGAGGSGESALL